MISVARDRCINALYWNQIHATTIYMSDYMFQPTEIHYEIQQNFGDNVVKLSLPTLVIISIVSNDHGPLTRYVKLRMNDHEAKWATVGYSADSIWNLPTFMNNRNLTKCQLIIIQWSMLRYILVGCRQYHGQSCQWTGWHRCQCDCPWSLVHDDVIKWKHVMRYWPFVRGIHRSPVNSPHKGHWRGALMFSLINAWTNGWVNYRDAGGLRRHRAHYYVTVMCGNVLAVLI